MSLAAATLEDCSRPGSPLDYSERPEQTPAPRLRHLWGLLFCLALVAGFGVVVVRSAWVTEDAYIMFRTIDNIWHGYGLTWNVTERVQVYTCPLWMFVLTPVVGITGEFYFTTTAVCMVVSLAMALTLVWKVAPTNTAAVLAVGALCCSKAFIDYSTSVLENPLTHLVLAVYCVFFFRVAKAPTVRGFFNLTLIACLGMLNRLDTALLFFPSLAWTYWHVPKLRGFGAAALAAVPLVLWEIFSLIYYGFLFPNTAYAKLNLGISTLEMMQQGVSFYANSLMSDPVTLTIIALGMVVPCLGRRWHEVALALGIGLYLVYIVKIGGDYMSGRFFTGPLVLAVVLLCRAPWAQRPVWALPCLLGLLALSLMMPRSPLRTGTDFGTASFDVEVDQWGIADERGYYYPRLGLLRVLEITSRVGTCKPINLEQQRERAGHEPGGVRLTGNIGMSIFRVAAREYVMDRCALGDAFLARLPMKPGCRVGHYRRLVPDGYPATVRTGTNQFADPKLGEYYEKLKLVTSGRLFSAARWRAIWEINTGQLNHLIDVEHYRYHRGPPPAVREARLAQPPRELP